MTTILELLRSYCQSFGHDSCYGLSWLDTGFLAAVALMVLVVVLSVVRRLVTGIPD